MNYCVLSKNLQKLKLWYVQFLYKKKRKKQGHFTFIFTILNYVQDTTIHIECKALPLTAALGTNRELPAHCLAWIYTQEQLHGLT